MHFGSRFNLNLLLIFMMLTGLFSHALAEAVSKTDDNPVAATVNGRPIYLNELKQGTDRALARYKKYAASSTSDETRKRFQKQELDNKVDFELLVQAGEKAFGKELEQKVEEKIKEISTVQAKGEHAAQKSVASNLNLDEYRGRVRRQLLADEYLAKQGIQDLRVTEEDAKKYYEQNKQNFQEAESVKVSHILIKLPKSPKQEEVDLARKEIERIHAEIIAGKNFAELAKQYSKCGSAKNGGDLGYIFHGYMPKDFDMVAFSLKVGEVSDVVRTKYGFHLIKSIDKKAARIQNFSEVKDFVGKYLLKQVQANKTKELVDELKRQAKVEVYIN